MKSRYILPAAFLLAFASGARALEPADLKPGLLATFGEERTGLTQLEPTVAIALAAGEAAHPRLNPTDEVRWAGYLNVVRAGKYQFSANAHGGAVSVTVGGKPMLSLAPTAGGKGPRPGPVVDLPGGIQAFTASFTGLGKEGARLEFLWEGPGFRREPVPHAFFGHLPKDRPANFAAHATQELGRFRFEELACIRCHKAAADDKMAAGLAERVGPNLTDVAKRAYPGWLDAWLADPKKLRPHTTMPKLFADTPVGKAERYAVVRYLTSLVPKSALDPAKPPTFSKDYNKSMDSGRVLFNVTGCAACHQPQTGAKKKPARNDLDDEKLPLEADDYVFGVGTAAGPTGKYLLGALGSKTRPEALANFLKDPLKTHPAGRMPNMVLEGKEALDLARYLCRVTDDGIDPKMPPAPDAKTSDKQWVERGKQLLVAKGCVNCHAAAPGGKPLVPAAAFPTLAAIRQAAPGKGCLSSPASPAPDYQLDAKEAAAVAAFLKEGLTGAGTKAPLHAARLTLRRFNCLNCHQRDGEGGLSVELADLMRRDEKAENADDIRPPVLTGIGHKSRTSWLKGVLTEKQRARPWMPLRMPQYGAANVGHMPAGLAALEGTTTDDAIRTLPLAREQIEAGRALVGKSGMGCISCHDISGIANSGTRGPDLATINQRVRYEWYARWLNQPLRMVPGTRMPQAFIEGKSPFTAILHGEGEAQAEAMWAYLALGPGLPLPDGMEPPKGLTLLVKDRPEVLRTFLKEGGNRAIAVGYPGGVSAAFAADECRLAYAWAGNFLDATPVWDKRGGKPALLLGPKFWTAPPGQPWGLTAIGSGPPDFAGRAHDPAYGVPLPVEPPRVYSGPRAVNFLGYALDKAGNPTFRYRLAGNTDNALVVAETPAPLKGGLATGLRRSFVLEAPPGLQPWFLAGTTAQTPRLLDRHGTALPLDLKTAESTAAANARVVLPAEGGSVIVLELVAPPAVTTWRFVAKPGGGWQALVKLPLGSSTLALNVWALPKDDEALFKGLAAQ